jgi:GH18 family chitinase
VIDGNSFFVTKGENRNVEIKYEQPAPAEEGSIELSAKIDIATTKKPTYTVKDAQGNIVTQGTLNFSNPITIDNLPATESGTKYTISVGELSENGIYKADPVTVNVTKFNTSKATIEYKKQTIATQDVTVNVKGLPNQQTATLTLTSDQGGKQEITLDKNDAYEIDIPKNGATWTVTATSINGYKVTTSPSTFTANQDNQNINITFEQQAPIEAGKKVIGYWENWKGALQAPAGTSNSQASYYSNDVEPYTHVLYSFLTLAKNPNPDNPANSEWNGSAVYESMTANNVLEVMKKYPEGTANWERTDNWMRQRIDALIESTHQNNGKFIWALGGWSDLQQTISPAQVDKLVDQLVALLKVSGDGIDFDWEHINQLANGQPNPNAKEEQAVLAETMLKLRQKLDAEGMQDKQIGYTTRFNAFMPDSKQYDFAGFNSDGEGIAIDDWLRAHGSSLNKVVNWVNIMAYDVGPSYMPNGKTWNMDVYKDVLNSFKTRLDPSLIVLGFEPGGQAAGGQWEGMDVDKTAIDYVANNNYGGSMFWAINQPPYNSTENTGLNADKLADYSRDKFDLE